MEVGAEASDLPEPLLVQGVHAVSNFSNFPPASTSHPRLLAPPQLRTHPLNPAYGPSASSCMFTLSLSLVTLCKDPHNVFSIKKKNVP